MVLTSKASRTALQTVTMLLRNKVSACPRPKDRVPEMVQREGLGSIEIEAGNIFRFMGKRRQEGPDKWDQDEEAENHQEQVERTCAQPTVPERGCPPGAA